MSIFSPRDISIVDQANRDILWDRWIRPGITGAVVSQTPGLFSPQSGENLSKKLRMIVERAQGPILVNVAVAAAALAGGGLTYPIVSSDAALLSFHIFVVLGTSFLFFFDAYRIKTTLVSDDGMVLWRAFSRKKLSWMEIQDIRIEGQWLVLTIAGGGRFTVNANIFKNSQQFVQLVQGKIRDSR